MRSDLAAAIDRVDHAANVVAYAFDWVERDGLVTVPAGVLADSLAEFRAAKSGLDALTAAACKARQAQYQRDRYAKRKSR